MWPSTFGVSAQPLGIGWGKSSALTTANSCSFPAGFLHGFMTLEPDTEIVYKCSDYYAPDCDGAVRFDDPDIGIQWPLDPTQAQLSPKDAAAPRLRDFDSPFTYEA